MNKEIFADYFEIIESTEMFSKLALSNNAETFLRIMKSVDDVLLFKDEISANPDLAEHVTNRIKTLLNIETEPNVLHPHDHAIAGYLYILSESNIGEFSKSWEEVKEKRLLNLWWAYGVGSHIDKGTPETQIVKTGSAFDVDSPNEYITTDLKEIPVEKDSAASESKEGRYRDPGGSYA